MGAVNSETEQRGPRLLAFFCVAIFLVPSYLVLPGPLRSNGSLARILAATFLVLVVLGFVLGRQATRRVVWPGAFILIAYFAIWLLLFGVGSTYLGSYRTELAKSRSLLPIAVYAGTALYAMTRVERRNYSFLFKCLALGSLTSCVIGILQVWLSMDLRLIFQPPGFVVNVTVDGTDAAPSLVDRYGEKRAFGTSQHAIEYSVLAAVTIPLTLHLGKQAKSRGFRLLALLGSLVALAAMISGISRSGVVALTAAFLVYVWAVSLRQLLAGVLVGALGLAIVLVAFPKSATALWRVLTETSLTDSQGEGSVLTRVQDYARIAESFRAHRLFGLGPGGGGIEQFGYLDNQWLQAVVQGGIFGVIAMVILTLGGLFGFGLALRRVSSPLERDQVFVMGSMYVGILASSVTFDLFSFPQVSLLFFLLFGMMWSSVRILRV